MSDLVNQLDQNAVRRRFNRRATSFHRAAFIHERCAQTLMERLDLTTLTPRQILDMGCGTGILTTMLARKFKRARLSCVDQSPQMLKQTAKALPFFARKKLLQESAEATSVADASVDLVTANLLLPWLDAPDALLKEARRVLKADAAFFFTSIGPGSFGELREAWSTIDPDGAHVGAFVDMHDLGDALGRAGFTEAVLDVERIRVQYNDFESLWADLRLSASGNALRNRRKGLSTNSVFARLAKNYPQSRPGAPLTVSLELVFGHAFARPVRDNSDTLSEFGVNIESISRRSS
ncbi:MAG: methyltransferase domain-containing protein [Pseudomonadota bacterium]